SKHRFPVLESRPTEPVGRGINNDLGQVLLLCTISVPVALTMLRLARGFLCVPLGVPLGLTHTVVLSLGATFLPAMGIGLMFVVLVRTTGASPAATYAGESLGALLGGGLFVFVLVGSLPPLAMAALASLVLALAGAFSSGRSVWGLVAVWAAGLLLGGPLDGHLEVLRFRQMLPTAELVETIESPYGRWAALRLDEQWSFFLDGQRQLDAREGEEAPGGLVHTALLQKKGPQRVLFVGGCREGARFALSHEVLHIDCPELNGVPWDSSGNLDHPLIQLVAQDPVDFLRHSTHSYDVIIHDGPGPNTVGQSRLYSAEFFSLIAQKLSSDGLLALSLSGSEHQMGDEVRRRNGVIYHSIRRFLPQVMVAPGDPALIFATASSKVTLDRAVLLERLEEAKVEAPTYRGWLCTDPFAMEQMALVNRSLALWPAEPGPLSALEVLETSSIVVVEPHSDSPLNTRHHPRAYWAARLARAAKFEPGWLALLQGLPGATRLFLGCSGLGLVVLALWGRRLKKPNLGLTIASAASAFAVMALQIVVLFWFQSAVGQAYIGLALLSAALMAGVSFGALVAHFVGRPRLVLLAAQLAIIAVGGLLWLILPLGELVGLLSVIVAALLGALLGLHFGCTSEMWRGHDDDAA
ncbi:MAG: hypothetical protein HN348_28945, partial [Proteobacteria bacterium]|nr:hypothetical protein [Pseudomonadota bacterium]